MKIKELQRHLRKEKIGALLLSNSFDSSDPNFVYLTGYSGFGFLLITPSTSYVLVPEMEYLRAKQTSRVRPVNSKDLVKDLKKGLNRKKIALNDAKTSLASLKRLKTLTKARFVDISPFLSQLRQEKTPEEIKLLKKACSLTDDIYHKVFMDFKKFKTEADVAAFMTYEAARLGCSLSFPPIVASGPNSSKPHHETSTQKLKRGFCIIDFGIVYKGVCSDMTRTIFIGSPTQKEIDLYHRLYRVQEACIQLCTPDRSFYDIDQYARKMLGPHAKKMIHSLGHGLGFQVHENPIPKKKSDFNILKLNSVITIEPGVYLTKGGIRIEDDVLVTEKGPKLLTKTGRHLLIIKKH